MSEQGCQYHGVQGHCQACEIADLRVTIAALEADKGEPDVFCCCENGDSFRVFAVRLKDTVRTLHICSRCGGVVRLTKEEVTP